MSIIPIDDWRYFNLARNHYLNNGRGKEEINKVAPLIINHISQNGPICSSDIDYGEMINWAWGPTKMSRAALEAMYFRGDLVIHHKKNTRKYYDLTHRHIPSEILNMSNPNKTPEQQHDWHLLRRIQSAGALWNRRSDALLGIEGLKTPQRNTSFQRLLSGGHIIEIKVEDMKFPMYILSKDEEMLKQSIKSDIKSSRTEFIAPLDNMMWDRDFIQQIFDFDFFRSI